MSADAEAPTADAPTTDEVARALGVDAGQLVHFVERHPNPKPTYILGWAAADPVDETILARWLEAREAGLFDREVGR